MTTLWWATAAASAAARSSSRVMATEPDNANDATSSPRAFAPLPSLEATAAFVLSAWLGLSLWFLRSGFSLLLDALLSGASQSRVHSAWTQLKSCFQIVLLDSNLALERIELRSLEREGETEEWWEKPIECVLEEKELECKIVKLKERRIWKALIKIHIAWDLWDYSWIC